MNPLIFFYLEPKKCFRVTINEVFVERSGTSAHAVYAIGDFRDPVVPTLSGTNGDVVTAYAY